MEKFRGVDYYAIEGLLSEEERMIRDAVRDWVEAEFLPLIAEHHRAGTFPVELIPKLGELGVFGANLKGYGCAGLSNVAYGLIMQELERGDSGLRSFGVGAGRARDVPDLRLRLRGAEGALAARDGAAARRSAASASPSPTTAPTRAAWRRARSVQGDGYVLNGTKRWITNGSIADVAVVWAKDDDGEIRGFLVERGHAGLQRRATSRASSRCARRSRPSSSFEDCRDPADSKLPEREGAARAARCLNQARYGIAWGAVGAAMACYDWALAVRAAAHPVRQADRGLQLVQQKLVDDAHGDHQGAAPRAAARAAEGRGPGCARSRSRWPSGTTCRSRSTSRGCARDILGANGIVDEYPVIRHMLNLETVNTYEGTHDIHTLIVGRDITGLDAFGIGRGSRPGWAGDRQRHIRERTSDTGRSTWSGGSGWFRSGGPGGRVRLYFRYEDGDLDSGRDICRSGIDLRDGSRSLGASSTAAPCGSMSPDMAPTTSPRRSIESSTNPHPRRIWLEPPPRERFGVRDGSRSGRNLVGGSP